MSIFESIITQFNNHIDITSGHLESLLPHIAEATHLFTEALLSEKKILCCTSGDSFAAGNQFCHSLLNGTDLQRPALPAIFLGNNTTTTLSSIANHCTGETYSRQIQALGQKNDVLLIIASSGQEDYLAQAISAAHDQQMAVVALLSKQHSDLASRTHNSDIVITLQTQTLQETLLLQYLISVILASQIEQQLFGNMSL